MTYEDAISSTVTREEARQEIEEEHGLSFWDFIAERGDHPYYDGSEVLGWLGY